MALARVTFWRPAPGLRGLIDSYFIFDITGDVADHILPQWAHMGWIVAGQWRSGPIGGPLAPVPEVALCGPLERALVARGTAGRVIALTMTPAGWSAFIDRPCRDLVGRTVPMASLLGSGVEALHAPLARADDAAALDLLDGFFSDRLDPRRVDPLVRRVHALIEPPAEALLPVSAAALAEAAGIDLRRLQRLCLKSFGLPPKRLLRRQRLLRALDAVRREPGDLWRDAIGPDFADQPHFVRECRWFMRMTPGQWRRRDLMLERVVGRR